ncbi:hypothetical protein [Singulisphaera sp. PoT]|uniref:hypothetical protein n=1 Tax=Singulisphaera sp. PoT TaxID=3411797 RepID=UPI003BF4CF3E
MIHAFLRSIAAIALGLGAGVIAVGLIEAASVRLYPLPPGIDWEDPLAVQKALAAIPLGALLLVLLAWALGSFVAGWVSARVAKGAPRAYATGFGFLFLAFAIVNLVTIPHPVWFAAVAVVLPLPAAYLGAFLTMRRRPVAAIPSLTDSSD